MRIIFLLLSFIFSETNQLVCVHNCFDIQINMSEAFQVPLDMFGCRSDTKATRCHGRIMAYYNSDGFQKYISYSLGLTNHIIDREIEELANENGFQAIIYILFLIEPLYHSDVVISAHVICQTSDNCALNYIKDLFALYNKQTNPADDLLPLLYTREVSKQLTCYDYKTKKIASCLIDHHYTCIINNTDKFQQECSSDKNTRLQYIRMITLPHRNPIKKILELIICNKNGCNEKSISKKIESMIYNYTFRMKIPFNTGQRLTFYLLHFIYLFIFINMFL